MDTTSEANDLNGLRSFVPAAKGGIYTQGEGCQEVGLGVSATPAAFANRSAWRCGLPGACCGLPTPAPLPTPATAPCLLLLWLANAYSPNTYSSLAEASSPGLKK